MKMLLVESLGNYMLMTRGGDVEPFRPSVIEHTGQFDQFVSQSQAKLICELKDSATDAEFKNFFDGSERDVALATEAFLAKFSVDAEDEDGSEEKPEEKPEAKKPAANKKK